MNISFESISKEVTKIYVGGCNVCRCGCAGDYVTRDENESLFEKRLNRFATLVAKGATVDFFGNGMEIVTGDSNEVGRCIVIYFN